MERKPPPVIKFESGYGEGGESSGDSGAALEYQSFYKWQRKGSQPLYIAESKGEGYVLTSVYNSYNWKNYTIVRDPKLFNK